MDMYNHPTMTSKSDEWETPQALFDALNDEFRFNLDPCASQINHKCDTYYTLEDNGLERSWGGACRVLQSTVLKNSQVGRKGIQRIDETQYSCCAFDPIQDGHEMVPSVPLWKSRNKVYQRSVAI